WSKRLRLRSISERRRDPFVPHDGHHKSKHDRDARAGTQAAGVPALGLAQCNPSPLSEPLSQKTTSGTSQRRPASERGTTGATVITSSSPPSCSNPHSPAPLLTASARPRFRPLGVARLPPPTPPQRSGLHLHGRASGNPYQVRSDGSHPNSPECGRPR